MAEANLKNAHGLEYEEPVPMYANNVRFEPTVWDLRILFGQLFSQTVAAKPGISWHTDVTLPWVQAKLTHFYLGLNIALYEADNGKIKIPAAVLPPLEAPHPELDPDNPQAVATFQLLQKLIADFRSDAGKV